MKKIIFCLLFILGINSSFASRSCTEQLKGVEYERSEYAEMFGMLSMSVVSIPVTLPLCIGFEISTTKVKNILALLQEASVKKGPHLEKVWRKFSRKLPAVATELGFDGFADALHKADLTGELCAAELVIENKDIFKIISQL